MDIDLTTHRAKFLFGNTFTKLDWATLDNRPYVLDNICKVFWASVWTYLFITAIYIVIVTTSIMFIPVGMQVLNKWFDIFWSVSPTLNYLLEYNTILGITMFIGLIGSVLIYFLAVVFGVIGSILFTAEKIGDYRQSKRDAGYVPEPSIIAGYYRALKEKTCIVVNYKNG